MGERGIIYGRASRDPKQSGSSVDKQIERGVAWASSQGVTTIVIRDDNRGATRGSRERPGFQRVRALIERGEVDVLILWEVSRSSRDAEESMGLLNAAEDNGVCIAVDGRRYDPSEDADRLQLQFLFIMAEQEGRRIKKRNNDSVKTNALRRTPHGRLPYGYRRIYDSRTGVLLEQTPFDESGALLPEAQVLANAAKALLAGTTLRKVCLELNSAGVPSPRRPNAKTLAANPEGVITSWDPLSLRQMLVNPTIAGRRIHQGEDVGEATWAPILEYSEWLALHALLTDPSRRTVAAPRGPEPRHLLSGIARCGECGARLRGATNQKRIKRAYTCRNEGCMRVMVTAGKVDEMVEAMILGLFGTPGFRSRLAAAHSEREVMNSSSADHSAEIQAKEEEWKEVDALRAAEKISLQAYIAETNRIERRLAELRAAEVSQVTSPALRKMLAAQTVAEGWRSADLIDRREVVRMLLDVKIDRATANTGRRFDLSRVTIDPSEFLFDDVLGGRPVGTSLAV